MHRKKMISQHLHGRQRESNIKLASVKGSKASPRVFSFPSRNFSALSRMMANSDDPSGIFFSNVTISDS